jgi:hypothetical protein
VRGLQHGEDGAGDAAEEFAAAEDNLVDLRGAVDGRVDREIRGRRWLTSVL